MFDSSHSRALMLHTVKGVKKSSQICFRLQNQFILLLQMPVQCLEGTEGDAAQYTEL